MRGFLFLSALCVLSSFSLIAGNDVPDGNKPVKVERLDSVVVSASRASLSTPVTFTQIGSKELHNVNPIFSLPMALSLQPSVVTTNEGGTGIGYSKMTVRGSKGSQINVTLNGITLNDAESQEVFWVNIPSLTNMLSSVQLQRGLGTSANGSGAFGASINMSTSAVGSDPFGSFDIARGSFNTFTSTVTAGTGLTKSGLYFNMAYSRNYTDGYIRNAKAKVQSALAVLGWMRENNSLKLTYLMGDEHTGITWEGIPMAKYLTDRKYNPAGAYEDALGNVRYYDNQTDNYTQNHLQLNYTHQFGQKLFWSTTANYTKGYGYYEQYKQAVPRDSVCRDKMNNYYLVLNSNLKYSYDNLDITGGACASRYDGDHYGSMIWNNILGDSFDYSSFERYRNEGVKDELSAFARAEYRPSALLNAYLDLQYRGVALDMNGIDDGGVSLDYHNNWSFFNPRGGITVSFPNSQKVYASLAVGHREPGRNDLKEKIKTMRSEIAAGNLDAKVDLKPEKMLDFEFGYQYESEKLSGSANIYLMEYRNMLLETGRLSNEGYAIKENVPESYRRGLELAFAWKPLPIVELDCNTTLSTNKIKNYDNFITEYDNSSDWTYLRQMKEHFDRTTMLMSPSVIGAANVNVMPFRTLCKNSLKTTTFSLSGKYVGKQYWDNTSNDDRSIPGYFVCNLAMTHEFSISGGKLSLGAYVNNLLNNKYYADAWVYRAHFQKENSYYQEEGLSPSLSSGSNLF
jgi:iron complex outermembrane receptor protein